MIIIYNFVDALFNVWESVSLKIDQFKVWFLEHQRRNLIAIFSSFVFIAIATTLAVVVTPRPSNLPSTSLYTAVPFGTLNKSATLTKSVFNAESRVLELHYTIYDGGESNQNFVDISKIFFTAITDHGGSQVTARSVPTSNNTVVVQFKNLSNKFNAVTIIAHDKNINTATVEAPSSVVAASASSQKSSPKSNADSGRFTINRDKVAHSSSLSFASQKQLQLTEYDKKIGDEKQVISQNKSAIKSYEKAINQQNSTVKNYERQLAETTKTDSQTSIDNAHDNIQQIRSKIGDAQQNIQKSQANISDFQHTMDRVKTDINVLPNPTNI